MENPPNTTIVLPYQPRDLQAELHNNLERFSVYNIHRRFGKTVFAVNQLIKWVTLCEHPKPRGAYIMPTYKQAKQVAWEYLKEYTRPIPGMTYNESELRADFPTGARISLAGGENPDALRGLYLDAAVLDEVAQLPPRLWTQVIRPALADRKGKALFIGTPFGTANQFHHLYQQAADNPGWTRKTLTIEDTQVLDPDEIKAARREMSPEEFDQEFMCNWSAAIKGAYYAKEIVKLEDQGRITDVPYDPDYPVITAWDLGIKDSTVITFWQEIASQIRCINCLAFTGTVLSSIIEEMRKLPYQYSQHIAPHDIAVRELGGGSRRTQAQRLGVNFSTAPNPREINVQSGINRVRTLLPRMWFDRNNCEDLLTALRHYRTEYNEQRQVLSNNALHDWTSDYADSVRYYAVTPSRLDFGSDLNYNVLEQGVF